MTNLKKLFEQATARPWKTVRVNDTRIMVHNLSNDGDNYSNHVCDAHNPANAQLITLAANHFEAVVEALESFVNLWPVLPNRNEPKATPEVLSAWHQARSVLAAIEKDAGHV